MEIIASSTQNHSAQYSPDGKKIVFVSDRSGAYEIWMCGADGSDPASLFSANGAPVGTPRWSPDGSRIVFDLAKDGRSVIALVDVNSGANRILVSGTADYMMPSWSRDGRFIYYVSPTGSNQVQIWKRAVDGVNAVQLTRNGGGEAFESPDGAILYYLKTREGIWQVPSSGGAESLVPGLEHVTASRYFFVTKSGLYFLVNDSPPWTIQYRAFSGGQISTVVTMERSPEFGTPSLSVSPDERWLLYSQLDQGNEDLMMLKSTAH